MVSLIQVVKGLTAMSKKILSLLSSFLFFIGTTYYSYILVKTAYIRMIGIKTITHPGGSIGFMSYFSLSNINLVSAICVLLALFTLVASIALIVLALKNKHHYLTAAISAVILALQFIIEKYTALQEYVFTKNLSGLSIKSYDIALKIKFLPFIIALLLSISCVILSIISSKSNKSNG